ncbi:MAG TPA: hypothetical protein VLF66_02980 [Thermoanaerobaculia bacterium]|nr:hypothetical protein [Thermoanaerobaculia bacterium]
MTAGLWYVVIVSMVIGAGMLGFWSITLAAGRVPEISGGSREIWFHVAAEVGTAGMLLSGAVATLADPEAAAGAAVSCLGLGMLLYSITVSPGYYVDRREWPMVAMLAGVWVLAAPAVVLRAPV